jgi:hypothetical protein
MGFALEERGICSAENLGSHGTEALAVIGHPADTETSPVTAHTPLESLSAVSRSAKLRFRISLEIRNDRIYEPYAPVA